MCDGDIDDKWQLGYDQGYDEGYEQGKKDAQAKSLNPVSVTREMCSRCRKREGDPIVLCGECRVEYAVAAQDKKRKDIDGG